MMKESEEKSEMGGDETRTERVALLYILGKHSLLPSLSKSGPTMKTSSTFPTPWSPSIFK
jgi:hypothetical protein